MEKLELPAEFPFEIKTDEQAERFGYVLHKVLHFDADWVKRVKNGDTKLCYQTGHDVMMNELRSMWRHDMSNDEKRQLVTLYAIERLK